MIALLVMAIVVGLWLVFEVVALITNLKKTSEKIDFLIALAITDRHKEH